jgi:hypothetical protein
VHAWIDRRAQVLTCLVVAVATVSAAAITFQKVFWNDELIRFYVTELPGMRSVWSALERGADFTPPLFYALTQASVRLFGANEFAMAVPAMAGVALACACTYAFVAHRRPGLPALFAVLVLITIVGARFAQEATPYGLVLGFAAGAFAAWQRATDGRARRTAAVVLLALSLAAATSVHYYSVLVLAPLGLGELVRGWQRRRVDWPVAGALAAGLLPVVAFLPLVRAASDFSDHYYSKPSWRKPFGFYFPPPATLPAVAWLALVAAAVGLVVSVVRLQRRLGRTTGAGPAPLPRHELVAVATLALLPFVGVLVAFLVTGAFDDRYALSALIGLSVLAAYAVHRLDLWNPDLGLAVVAILLVLGVGLRVSQTRYAVSEARSQRETLAFLRLESRGKPVVIAGAHEFFELSHAAHEDGRGPRLQYLADVDLAVRRVHSDTAERSLLEMAPIAPLTVLPYRGYLASHPRFLLYGEAFEFDWVTGDLRARHWAMHPVARRDGRVLYEVVRPG